MGPAMELVDPIPVVLEAEEAVARLRFDPARAGFPSLDALLDLARRLIRPRALFDVAFVGAKGESTVEVGGVAFVSPVLRRNLEKTNKVFPYVLTVGPDLERAAAVQGDLLKQYYLEGLADMALEKAHSRLAAELGQRFGLGPLSNLSPGSLEDWPLTEQPKLFALLGDTEKLAGVRLTESLLMVPRKSVSGLLFPSEEGFVACRLCDRPRCQGRKAPYDGAGPRAYR